MFSYRLRGARIPDRVELAKKSSGLRLFLVLHVGFAMAGAYTTLLGTVLPVIAARWALHDDRSGALFLAQFTGSTLGPFVRGRSLPSMVALGFAGVAASCCALTLLHPGQSLREELPTYAVLFTYGLGLGVAMTSTSVWMAARFAGKQGSALESLNAIWAVGAGSTPWLVLPWLHLETLSTFLVCFSLPAACLSLWVLMFERAGLRRVSMQEVQPLQAHVGGIARPLAAVLLGFLSFASVGAESALGGWMTTYIGRATRAAAVRVHAEHAHASLHSLGAASGFWVGLLGSRVLASLLLLAGVPEEVVALAAVAIGTAATALLLTLHVPGLLVGLAVASGFGVGPLYPLVLSHALRLLKGRWVFALAGLGSAIVPWCAGMLSSAAGSLNVGLALPLALMVSIGLVLLAGRTELRQGAQ